MDKKNNVFVPVTPFEVFDEIERWGKKVMESVLLKTFKLEIREPEGLIEVEMSGVMLKRKAEDKGVVHADGKTCPKCEAPMQDVMTNDGERTFVGGRVCTVCGFGEGDV